jgi:hypothetical protein
MRLGERGGCWRRRRTWIVLAIIVLIVLAFFAVTLQPGPVHSVN